MNFSEKLFELHDQFPPRQGPHRVQLRHGQEARVRGVPPALPDAGLAERAHDQARRHQEPPVQLLRRQLPEQGPAQGARPDAHGRAAVQV